MNILSVAESGVSLGHTTELTQQCCTTHATFSIKMLSRNTQSPLNGFTVGLGRPNPWGSCGKRLGAQLELVPWSHS